MVWKLSLRPQVASQGSKWKQQTKVWKPKENEMNDTNFGISSCVAGEEVRRSPPPDKRGFGEEWTKGECH